jgi:hypothetical protein
VAETTKKKYGDWRDNWPAGEYLHKDPDYVEGTHPAENPEETLLRHVWPQAPQTETSDNEQTS